MSLINRLKADIAQNGPLSVAEFMHRCLHDPIDGYYSTRPALGAEGDFITAPMISQMFGELLGLWCIEVWLRLGRPERFSLVEVGPGDGTLMSDLLRAGRAEPGFLAAAELWLVETSRPLRERQAGRLRESGVRPRWVDHLGELPRDCPLIIIANELLDCLPAQQFVQMADRWIERQVGLNAQGDLMFGLAPWDGPDPVPSAPVLEVSPAQEGFGALLGQRIAAQSGAALLIDYGRDKPEFGDTLQALFRHEKIDPLARPGESDLTVYADFPTVLAAARRSGARSAPILPQGAFLGRLGIEMRAETLMAARPDRAAVIDRQVRRLVDPGEMGALFKVACIHSDGLDPPGFERPDSSEDQRSMG